MNGFERRKQQKKENIIRAALELFMKYGFKKVSVNDIAVKANVSPVTIYNHYGNKDSLVYEVVRYQLGIMMESYKKIIYGNGTFPEKIEEITWVDAVPRRAGIVEYDLTFIIPVTKAKTLVNLVRDDHSAAPWR